MKHTLLAGAALCALAGFVATPAQAQGLELNLRGQFIGYAIYNNQDEPAGTSLRGLDLRKETEVHFDGKTTLDNGLSVGVHIEINVDRDESATGSVIEESNMFISGGWGRFVVGEEDGVAYLLQVAAPSADWNIDGLRQYTNSFDLGLMAGANTGLAVDRLDYDHAISGALNKVTYMTPVFNGFQAGVSYVPSLSEGDQSGLAPITANKNAGFDDGVEVAARFQRKFDAVELTIGGGWSDYDREVTAAGQTDRQGYNIGADVNWGPFGLGAALFEDDNGISADGDSTAFIIGADYTMDAYKFGATYYERTDEAAAGTHTTAGDLEYSRWTAGVQYQYGPGMRMNGNLTYLEAETGVAGDAEYDGYQFALGTTIDF